MSPTLPKTKMYRYCLADIAKGIFNGMIGNYLLYFFQPTVKSGNRIIHKIIKNTVCCSIATDGAVF